MQSVDGKDILGPILPNHLLPQHSSRASMNGAFSGPHSTRSSFGGLRDRQGMMMPAINTTRSNQNLINGQNASDMQTPGTGYDMNFTPLLPSQLLMGSPFQPGSPTSFGPSQFQNISSFPQANAGQQSQHQSNSITSPTQNQSQLSPQMYQNMVSPSSITASGFYGGPQMSLSAYAGVANNIAAPVQLASGLVSGTSRTVYLGNIPADTSAEEILGHVRSGQIESVRLLPDKNCAFISFLDSSSAVHFHSDAILKKLAIRGQDIKIGWGKPSQVPSSVAVAVQQSGASRNVYLGTLPSDITEEQIREDLSKFGAIDTIKLVKEKAIGFVHFLSISSAMKAVSQLPQETKWQAPRRVFYGKDRCAYVSKTQQQNAAQYLGIAPGFAHVLNSADRDMISNALAQQSVAAAAVATAAGGANNLGNRTVYLGNIHPETTTEEICNVVRGGLLHHIRYIADKHICFVTFIDPTAAASFYALSNMQGLMIHNRRLKIGWGKHSGALPPAIALAVSGGASRNVYIGNIDESWSEERLRQDFSEYGEIELINALREKSCAFVNFTNIANAIKAIEAVRGKEEYKRFKINFGKDRCGNPPRQVVQAQHDGLQAQHSQDETLSPPPAMNGIGLHAGRSSGTNVSPANSGMSRAPGSNSGNMLNGSIHQLSSSVGNNNPLTVYLNQMSSSQGSHNLSNQNTDNNASLYAPSHQHQYSSVSAQDSFYHGGPSSHYSKGSNSLEPPTPHYTSHGSSNSFSINASGAGSSANGMTTVGGLLAPTNVGAAARQHSRAISLPAFTQVGPYNQPQNGNESQQHHYSQQQHQQHQLPQNNRFGGLGGGANGYGLAIQGDSALPRWAEEEITS